jgi:hypothetical protein
MFKSRISPYDGLCTLHLIMSKYQRRPNVLIILLFTLMPYPELSVRRTAAFPHDIYQRNGSYILDFILNYTNIYETF